MPIVTLSTKGNVKLTKQLNERFKRPIYLNEYKTKLESKNLNNDNLTRFYLDASFQELEDYLSLLLITLLLMMLIIQLTILIIEFPRVDITDYNVLIDGRIFYGQPINDQIKNYDEIREIAAGQGDDYVRGCLLDYQYLKKIISN